MSVIGIGLFGITLVVVVGAVVGAVWFLRLRVRAKLTIRESAGPGLEFPIRARHVSIGSEEGRQIMVSHPKVSGLHATLSRERDGSYVLRDRSRLGTRVNGEPVTETVLRSGDLIRLGDSVDLIFTRIG